MKYVKQLPNWAISAIIILIAFSPVIFIFATGNGEVFLHAGP